MLKTLVTIALLGLLGWLMAKWVSPDVGWATFAGGLILMILVSGRQLSKVSRWARNASEPPPISLGPWNDILAQIYRTLRLQRQEIEQLNRHIDGIMLAAEALPDGAVTLDESMAVTWCNKTACEHIGLNLDTDRDRSIFNILRAPEFLRYARQKEWDSPLLLHVNSDGRQKSLLIQMTPYGVGQFLVVTRDVTQMEKLETTRKDFVANVSHEMRTPLTVLAGFLETLRDMPADSLTQEQRAHYQDLMLEQAHRMQTLVADLLTLSTLESSPSAQGSPVRMDTVIHNALQQAKVLSNDQHVFVTHITENLCVSGVETELASAVSNLLTNAVRYTPKGGTITVSWTLTDSGTARYAVQDTGIGIAAQDIPRLTERFYRVDRGRSRSTGGTGLGLAITRHVAMRHDAELHIQSRFGEGSEFSLEFPKSRVSVLEA